MTLGTPVLVPTVSPVLTPREGEGDKTGDPYKPRVASRVRPDGIIPM